ncbi:GntR family transcriptional regulator [Ensifer sp. IC4062]|nr:GntR family transcriptional regulator [Ensifer sp. IC4062]MCA1444168.1 GntR family transcriptional regulator [Ensifer sp. IC4062]
MQTRYAAIARELTEAIAQGRYSVGSLLPKEVELANQFKVSRSTIRAAMRELLAAGLISRKKNAGTRVEANSIQSDGRAFAMSLSSIEAIQQFGAATQRQIQHVDEVIADHELAGKLGCKPGSRWLKVSSVRRILGDDNALPICWTDVYIDVSFSAKVAPRLEDFHGIFGELIESIAGRRIIEIRQDISACGLPDHMAPPLLAKPGDHALEIRRQYLLSPASLVEISLSYHPAARYQYTTRLTRRDTGDL